MKADFSKLFINNQWVDAPKTQKVKSPYDDKLVGEVGIADVSLMKKAIEGAAVAFGQMKTIPTYQIVDGLTKIKKYFEDNVEEVARDLSEEAGKPITLARAEVGRGLHVIEDGIEECKRLYGEIMQLDSRPWGEKEKHTYNVFLSV